MIKNFFLKLDQFPPDDIFAMITRGLESDESFLKKMKSVLFLEIGVFSLSPVIEEFRSDKPFAERVRAFLP